MNPKPISPFEARRLIVKKLPPPREITFMSAQRPGPDRNELFPTDTSTEFTLNPKCNLIPSAFPWKHFPILCSDNLIVPPIAVDELMLTSTNLRDGFQGLRKFLSPEQMVEVLKTERMLGSLIKKSEMFIYPRYAEAVEMLLAVAGDSPELTPWVRANKNDLKLLSAYAGVFRELGMLTSCSDFHIFGKFAKQFPNEDTRKHDVLMYYLDLIHTAFEHVDRVRIHLEDVTRADIFGFVVPFLKKVSELSEARYNESDGKKHVVVRLCDTLGLGVPYVDAALPMGIPKLIHAAIVYGGIPSEHLEFHGHDDFALGVEATLAAWKYGCKYANGTFFGIGERIGNVQLELLLFRAITESMLPQEIANFHHITRLHEKFVRWGIIPDTTRLVSKQSTTTNAGIHISGAGKNAHIYSSFDTQDVLGVPFSMRVSSMSGRAGVVCWIGDFFKTVDNHLMAQKIARLDSARTHPIAKKRTMLGSRIRRFEKSVTAISDAINSYYQDSGRLEPLQDNEVAAFVFQHLTKYGYILLKLEDKPGELNNITNLLKKKGVNIMGIKSLTPHPIVEGDKSYVYDLIRVVKDAQPTVMKILKGTKTTVPPKSVWSFVFTGNNGHEFISPYDNFFELEV
ncbi:hypothetical protein KJ780_04140 [Candidatus Micrarchaeota archaeon]|nr:hypothetical protein [Candidatus Micrarchaeota archaeon]